MRKLTDIYQPTLNIKAQWPDIGDGEILLCLPLPLAAFAFLSFVLFILVPLIPHTAQTCPDDPLFNDALHVFSRPILCPQHNLFHRLKQMSLPSTRSGDLLDFPLPCLLRLPAARRTVRL